MPLSHRLGAKVKLLGRRYLTMTILCSFHLLVLSQPLCADRLLLFEIIASEGMSWTCYQSDYIKFEPHEFPEFNHEIGVNSYLYKTLNWFGIGGCLGCIYNLNGASSVYIDDPTLKFMLHWLKFPMLLSFAAIRNSSVMHFDIGIYGSLFLVGERTWKDIDSGIDEIVRLTNKSISHDFGIRAQLFIDMALFGIRNTHVELGGGLGFIVEKSLIDISKESTVKMNSYRFGICITMPILGNPNKVLED